MQVPIQGQPSQRIDIRLLILALLLIWLLACGGSSPGSTMQGPPPPPPPPPAAVISYVDCSAATNGTGTQANPWNTLAPVSATTFNPGDQILINRGTTCNGILAPLGSGTTASPIVVDAYGTGPQPIIDGGMNTAAVQLVNQQGWEINNLEIVGGNFFGVYVQATAANTTFTHFRLTNLNVHGAHYATVALDDSAEIQFLPGFGDAFNDVVIDGVTVHDSHVANGLDIDAGDAWGSNILGNNITVQNSTAYNIDGDGILLRATSNGLMQNNVAHDTGQCAVRQGCNAGPSSGIWGLFCHTCTVQNNESYSHQSQTGWDGGDYVVEVWDNDNTIQYNYGHDTVGYCVAVHSAGAGIVGTNNIIRYNVCSNNSQQPNSPDVGEIEIATWQGGSLNGVQIYNNTFYFNPVTPGPAFDTTFVSYSGTNPNFFKNNIIYSTVPYLIKATSDFAVDNNIYWTVGGAAPDWNMDGTDYTTLASYQSASGQDAHSLYTDPMLNTPTYHIIGRPTSAFTLLPGSPAIGAGANVCSGISGCLMGTQDFWGNSLPTGSGYNIGAWQ